MRPDGLRPDRPRSVGGQRQAGRAGRLAGAPPRARARQIAWLVLIAACLVGIPVLLALRPSAAGHLLAALPVLAMAFLGLAWWESQRALASERDQVATEAEQLVLRQRTFLQDAAHQFRSPITIALGHAELLAAALAGTQRRDIDVIVGELERLKALSERLLLVSASENADFLELAPVELGPLAADLVHRWRPVADRRWLLEPVEPALAFADRHRLEMALDALMENAVQHTGPGDEIAVSVRGTDSDGFTRIVVADTGEGIAEQDIPYIFDRFTSIGGRSRGTGLGLALVRAIAHGHGGRVTMSSTVGLGSAFEVLIPAAREPGAPITGADPGRILGSRLGRARADTRRREARCE